MPCFEAATLAAWADGGWDPEPPGVIAGITQDTRGLRAGDLYVALRGEKHDGHDFVGPAFEKGAAGAVVREEWHAGNPVPGPLLRVADPLRALGAMAAAYRRSLRARIVGVTGSAGKTTVKEMIADVLAESGQVCRTHGNWNNEIGVPLSLLRAERGCDFGVFEVGTNHPGELSPLCAMLAPEWGVVTNVGPSHLEAFRTVDRVAEEKAALVRSLPSGGVAVLDRQGEYFDKLRAAAPCRVVSVAVEADADYAGQRIDGTLNKVEVRESAGGEGAVLDVPQPGPHTVVNLLMAVAVGRVSGMEWDAITTALSSFRAQPMRWEETELQGVRIINDAYNANPMSVRAAIRGLCELTVPGRRWVVLGEMLELGEESRACHEDVGRFAGASGIDGLVLVGVPGGWMADAAAAAGFPASGLWRCENAAAAVDVLLGGLRPGDVLLLKASRGTRLEQVLESLQRRWETET